MFLNHKDDVKYFRDLVYNEGVCDRHTLEVSLLLDLVQILLTTPQPTFKVQIRCGG